MDFCSDFMDHASSRKKPLFSMQMQTSIRSTFGMDCRDRGQDALDFIVLLCFWILLDEGLKNPYTKQHEWRMKNVIQKCNVYFIDKHFGEDKLVRFLIVWNMKESGLTRSNKWKKENLFACHMSLLVLNGQKDSFLSLNPYYIWDPEWGMDGQILLTPSHIILFLCWCP